VAAKPAFPDGLSCRMANRGAQRWLIRRVLQGWQKPADHTMLDYGLSKSKAGMKRDWGMTRRQYRSNPPMCMWRSSCIKVVRVAADCPRSVVRRSRGLPCRDLGCHKPSCGSDLIANFCCISIFATLHWLLRPYKQLIGNKGYRSAQQGFFFRV
jgi:hypothetical protein